MPNLSSRNLSPLPLPPQVEAQCRALAMADAILAKDRTARTFSFDTAWDEENGDRLASMRTRKGAEWFILFRDDGRAVLKAFDPEKGHRPEAVTALPERFADFAQEAAFKMATTTFLLWHDGGDQGWQTHAAAPGAGDPDGSEALLQSLVWTPREFQKWAVSHYGKEVPIRPLEQLWKTEPLTGKMMRALQPNLDPDDVADAVLEIGYPQQSHGA